MANQSAINRPTFWQCFRLIFVVFSLYLMGDAFYRWDGFSYYGTFADFLPSIALITVLFAGISLFVAMSIWITVKAMKWLFTSIGWKIKAEHIMLSLLSLGIFFSLLLTLWVEKKYLFRFLLNNIPSEFHVKLLLVVCVFLVSIIITWVIRNKLQIIQERITPLVWLFGIFSMLSVFMVVYHAWIKEPVTVASETNFKYSAADNRNKPNILLVTFDALRAESMSVYGYKRKTTPFILKLAEKATVFRKAESEGNYTFPTTISLMTGKRVWTHKHYHSHGYASNKQTENIAYVLKKNGYYTMMYSANKIASVENLGIAAGIDVAPNISSFYSTGTLLGAIDFVLCKFFCDKIKMHDWLLKEDFIFYKYIIKVSKDNNNTLYPPELAFNKLLADMDKNPPEPFFAWVHIMPPHLPILPPKPYMGMFNHLPQLRTNKSNYEEQLRIRQNITEESSFPQELTQTVNIFRDRYDEFIVYCDKQFEEFIAKMNKRNKLKNTIIIISADHGESFEHGYFEHGGAHLYEQVTHIPLIIKEPEQSEGSFVDDLVEQIDIPATILDLANIPLPSWIEGRSLVPLMRGGRLPSRPSFSMSLGLNNRLAQPIVTGTIATWDNEYKLIHYYNYNNNNSLLFNLKNDPHELNNIFEKEPEVGQRLLSLIMNNLDKANKNFLKRE